MAVLNQFLTKIVVQIVNPIILLLSAVAFLVFIWGVFMYIYNAEDSKKRAEGQSAIMWGLVGLVIIFGAYGILNVLTTTFNLGNNPIIQNRGL